MKMITVADALKICSSEMEDLQDKIHHQIVEARKKDEFVIDYLWPFEGGTQKGHDAMVYMTTILENAGYEVLYNKYGNILRISIPQREI
jgi:hypothetical protein